MEHSRNRSLVTFALAGVMLAGNPLWAEETPEQTAWNILEGAAADKSADKRAKAVRVLGLIVRDRKAAEMAEKALEDEKPDVRVAGATALGEMDYRASIPKLRSALADKEPKVVLAAAQSLLQLKDKGPAYEVYYAVLTGQRKSGQGLVAGELQSLQNPKNLAEIGVGFVPFGGLGLFAFNALTKDDVSPARASAARILANDPDPQTTQALVQAISDKSWIVREGALEAIAKRDDPALLPKIDGSMSDQKDVVSYTASAAVIRLTHAQRVLKPGHKEEKLTK